MLLRANTPHGFCESQANEGSNQYIQSQRREEREEEKPSSQNEVLGMCSHICETPQ